MLTFTAMFSCSILLWLRQKYGCDNVLLWLSSSLNLCNFNSSWSTRCLFCHQTCFVSCVGFTQPSWKSGLYTDCTLNAVFLVYLILYGIFSLSLWVWCFFSSQIQFPLQVHSHVFLKPYFFSSFFLILKTMSMLLWTETWRFQIMYEIWEYCLEQLSSLLINSPRIKMMVPVAGNGMDTAFSIGKHITCL